MRKLSILAFLICVSGSLGSGPSFAAPAGKVTSNDFDRKYKKQIYRAFCSDSEFKNCFPMKKKVCIAKLRRAYPKCRNKIFKKRQIAAVSLTSEAMSQMGACLGSQLGKSYLKKRKVACKVRPENF